MLWLKQIEILLIKYQIDDRNIEWLQLETCLLNYISYFSTCTSQFRISPNNRYKFLNSVKFLLCSFSSFSLSTVPSHFRLSQHCHSSFFARNYLQVASLSEVQKIPLCLSVIRKYFLKYVKHVYINPVKKTKKQKLVLSVRLLITAAATKVDSVTLPYSSPFTGTTFSGY